MDRLVSKDLHYYEPAKGHGLKHDPFNAIIAPRPIGWISSRDASGNVNGVFNFEPMDGSLDGPYGDIVYLTEGPDGALYYLDLGYSDIGGTFGVSSVRRIEFSDSNLAPVAAAASI